MADDIENINEEAFEEEEEENGQEQGDVSSEGNDGQILVSGMFENWFLDYASYVILERAVPAIEDGLKPVQRRILHAMKEMDDGRFNKVANIIGQTMQYHPHGDAAIGDAIVNLGQKDLMIETQGNWGDIRTGDRAAASRYIEARLSKFALEVAFNADTTEWQLSYDGRKKEPVTLPVKFPLVLAQGVEGIAVGLSTKIMPHNFIELCKGSIDVLKDKKTNIFPDFPTGGTADFSDYNGGQRGGRIRVRCRIDVIDKKTLVVRDTPYGTTTSTLIDSIIKANDSGKIKIKKVVDNTAQDVEIEIQLAPGISPNVCIDALYAFTDCEVSISPNACIIIEDKPHFLEVNDILRISTKKTVGLLKWELEINKADLAEKWHFSSLEKIFIENRIYRDIEECETWEAVIEAIDKGLDPFKHLLIREVTRDDIVRLTEIKIKRISKYDAFKADEYIKKLDEEMAQVEHDLAHITDYAIAYFERLIEKYGKGRERKTEIEAFDTIAAKRVAVANQKLYINRKEGFIGYGLKKDEYICDCSDLDDIIVFRRDGQMVVTKIADKVFVGKDIIYANVWKKNDKRMTYNMIYADPKMKKIFAKRFNVTSITRDREYDLTTGNKDCKMLYFTANPNSESEVVLVQLSPNTTARIKEFDFDFGELAIKGRGARGNMVTKYTVRKVSQKQVGESTIGGRDIWLDETIGRLNYDKRGTYLGSFDTDDLILVIHEDGSYELTNHDLTNRFKCNEILLIEQFDPEKIISAVHYDGKNRKYFVKRFQIETKTLNQRFIFVTEERGSKPIFATTAAKPVIEYNYIKKKGGKKVTDTIDVEKFIDLKGWKALGNQLGKFYRVSGFKLISSEEPESSNDDDDDTGNEEKEDTEHVTAPKAETTDKAVAKKPEEKEEKAKSSEKAEKPEKKEGQPKDKTGGKTSEKSPEPVAKTSEKEDNNGTAKSENNAGKKSKGPELEITNTDDVEMVEAGTEIEFDISPKATSDKAAKPKKKKSKKADDSQLGLF